MVKKSKSNSPQHSHYIAIVAIVAVVAVVILVMNSMQTSTPVEDMVMEEDAKTEAEFEGLLDEELSAELDEETSEEGQAIAGQAYKKSSKSSCYKKLKIANKQIKKLKNTRLKDYEIKAYYTNTPNVDGEFGINGQHFTLK